MSAAATGGLINRRSLILGTASASAGIAVLRHTEAATASERPRKNIADPAVDQAEVRLFREAVRRLKAKDAANPAADGWHAIANPHVDHCFTGDLREIHFGWTFLPWHRAYLLAMERRLQTIVAEPKLRLFYWDWFATNSTPPAYATASAGTPTAANALFDDTRAKSNADRPDGYKFDTIGKGLLGYDKESELVSPKTFSEFGGGEIPANTRPNKPGNLEIGPHNHLHVWIGGRTGNMAQAFSPRDPVFLSHHCNIDRLWQVWLNNKNGLKPGEKRENPNKTEWLNKTFPMPHPSGVGTVSFKVADLLNTRSQGYFYDREQPNIVPIVGAPNVPGLLSLKLNAAPLAVGPEVSRTESLSLNNDQIARLRDFAFDPTQIGRLVLENVEVPTGATKVDVYLNVPNTNESSSDNLVGSFSLFNPGPGAPPTISFSLPVSDRARRLIANQPNISFSLRAANTTKPVAVGNIHLEVE